MNQFDRSLPMMLYRTLDVVMPEFRAIFKRFRLTEQQWRVLRVLWVRDGCALLELAEATCVSGPSLVGVIDRLSRDGLVRRRRSDTDRRVVRISLTRKGHQLEKRVVPSVDEAYRRLERSISPSDWRALMKGLDAVMAASPRERRARNNLRG